MNKFWQTVLPIVGNILRKKPVSISLGDKKPSEGEIITGGAEALLIDALTKPSEYPESFNIEPTHGGYP